MVRGGVAEVKWSKRVAELSSPTNHPALMLRVAGFVAGLLVFSGVVSAAPLKEKQPQSSVPTVCHPLAGLGMDAQQAPSEFAEPPLVRVEDQLFIIGLNWDLKRFSTRGGSGGRRRYVLARLDPDTLQPLENTSGDAPQFAFGPSAIGLLDAGDKVFLLAGGHLLPVDARLRIGIVGADLANSAGQVRIAHAGDLFAITGVLVKKDMRYYKLWVWNNHTHTLIFSHEFQLTQRAHALAIDAVNKAVVLATEDGIREMSYVDGADRMIMGGLTTQGWGFSCARYLILPRAERYSGSSSYALFDPGSRKSRYWTSGGQTYAAGTCATDALLAIGYKFKLHERKNNGQRAYEINGSLGRTVVVEFEMQITSEDVARYDLDTGKGSQIAADLPLEVPLASAWDPERKKLFVMTTGHICAVQMGETAAPLR